MQGLTYKYYRKNGTKIVYIILHGGGPVGVETDFISSIFDAIAATRNSVLCFNFPYCEREEEASSGLELKEEIDALKRAVDFAYLEGFSKIIFVAKSLGGIIASYYLEQFPDSQIELIILGYIPSEIKQRAISHNLKLVIQGTNDRFASPIEVKKNVGSLVEVIEILDADHSYRNSKKEPVYQETAIKELMKWVKKNRFNEPGR